MATREQIAGALKRAHAAGDQDAARKLAAAYRRTPADAQPYLPLPGDEPVDPATFTAPVKEPTPISPVGETVGAAETGLSFVSGLTTGTAGMLGGALKGLAEQILSGKFGTDEAAQSIADSAGRGAEALTYAPRTPEGQRNVGAIGEVAKDLAPLIAVTPVEGALASESLSATLAPAKNIALGAVDRGVQKIRDAIPSGKTAGAAGPGSAGAAEAPDALIRRTNAEQLGFKDGKALTKGQATREFGQQQFEGETAKNAEFGAPIRDRFENQNAHLQQVLDNFIDESGGVAPDLRSVGLSVEKGLRARAAADKTRIRTAYNQAEKAGELETPVTLGKIVSHLNESAPEAEVANVLKAARAKALQIGIASEDEAGNLVAQPSTLKQAEIFRRSIGNATNKEPTNIRQASIMKGLLDEETQGLGGTLYKQARAARAKYSRDYEQNLLAKQLLGTKRGSADRAIAYEDTLGRTILKPEASLDDVRNIRRLLQTQGDEGSQAWKDLQGGTLQHLKDEATKNVAENARGDRIFSAAKFDKAIQNLDKSGKLDFVFGKQGAEKLRTLNDVARDVLTVTPGAVNTSNTASAIAALLDITLSATTGIPAPLASSFRLLKAQIKDARLRARVEKTLQ